MSPKVILPRRDLYSVIVFPDEGPYRVLVVSPGDTPFAVQTTSPFDLCKKLIEGGYVQMVPLADGVCLFCDEEGTINGKWTLNRDVPDIAAPLPIAADFIIKSSPDLVNPGERGVHHVYGPFVLGRHDFVKDEPLSLTDADVAKYLELLK